MSLSDRSISTPGTESSATPRNDAVRTTPRVPSDALREATPSLGDDGRPIVGHTIDFVLDAQALVDRLSRQYGPNFRMRMFSKPVLAVGHPDAVRDVLMDKDRNFSSYLGWVDAIGNLFSRGLMLLDFEEHRIHRSVMQIAFRSEAIRGYADLMNPIIASGLDRWDSQPPTHFYPAIKSLTLDLAAEVFLGTPLGPDADRLNQAFVNSVQASIAIIKKEVPFLSYRRGMQGRRLLESFFGSRIETHRTGNGRDMFTQLCQATTEDGRSFTDREIVDHMIFLLMAAHDTTTSSLTAMVWALAQNPEWQERLREESATIGGPQLAWELKDRLVLADRVFKEALRMFPPVPFIGRRAIDACTIGGIDLPANTGVTVCALVTHFLEDFWTEPRRFDPDRFAPERAEDKRHSHVYYPFGGGAHTCLGMHFAGLQVKAFLHQFLQRFRVSLHPGYTLHMRPIPIPKPADGLPIVLERLGS